MARTFASRDAGNTARTWRIFLKPTDAQGKKPLAPQLDRWPRNPQTLCKMS